VGRTLKRAVQTSSGIETSWHKAAKFSKYSLASVTRFVYNGIVQTSSGAILMPQSKAQQRIDQYLLICGIFQVEGFKAIESAYGVLVYMDTLIVPLDVVIHVLAKHEIEFLFDYQQRTDGVLVTSKY
jgi:hypothetical protein